MSKLVFSERWPGPELDGLQFWLKVERHPSRGFCIYDCYGFFLPVPMEAWIRYVELPYQAMKGRPGVIKLTVLYNFCRDFQHTYICLN